MVTDKNTVSEIKKYLDEQGIEYPMDANKKKLLELVGQSNDVTADEVSSDEKTEDDKMELPPVVEEVPVEEPIPEPEPSNPTIRDGRLAYTVQDTDARLAHIATRLRVNVGKLRKYNPPLVSTIWPGMILYLEPDPNRPDWA